MWSNMVALVHPYAVIRIPVGAARRPAQGTYGTRPRKASAMTTGFQNVIVIGAGTMGHGIAQVCAMTGRRATLVDIDAARLEAALAKVASNLSKGVARGKVAAEVRDRALPLLSSSTDLAAACADADLVVEAVPEDMDLKERILRTVDASAPAHAVLASNTSSMSITALGAFTQRPERVIGLHFFNPVHIMALLEIVTGELTDPDVTAACQAFATEIGKTPIVVRDAPGFATSRLGIAVAMEAIRMVQEGVASPQDIDTAMELGYRFPMGPLKLTDLVGLDVRLAITEHLHRELGTDTFRPPQLLKRLVRAGKLGKKSGQGFYDWES
jgi:3-hydroxybutyryl-CoA dehydrogenase